MSCINGNSTALKMLNTFSIDVQAHNVVTAYTESELIKLCWQALDNDRPILVLGSGSNVLFLENYSGTVLLNRINGMIVSEDTKSWYVHVSAGENWHDIVKICLNQRIPGLENLAMIPGCVGSAPIQNIGAYGVELKQICEYVDIIQLKTGEKMRLSAIDCQFGYRESIFKHDLREHNVIVAVCLRLTKSWKPVLHYGALSRLNAQQVTPRQIYEIVCKIRRNTLPDPALFGNAGSFFKNPVISASEAKFLINNYPDAPHYLQLDGRVKLSAGWLIDRCGLKGSQFGGAALHDKQALVLINTGKATGSDIATLARYIRLKIANHFSIWLEPEVRFISAWGEVDAKVVV